MFEAGGDIDLDVVTGLVQFVPDHHQLAVHYPSPLQARFAQPGLILPGDGDGQSVVPEVGGVDEEIPAGQDGGLRLQP